MAMMMVMMMVMMETLPPFDRHWLECRLYGGMIVVARTQAAQSLAVIDVDAAVLESCSGNY